MPSVRLPRLALPLTCALLMVLAGCSTPRSGTTDHAAVPAHETVRREEPQQPAAPVEPAGPREPRARSSASERAVVPRRPLHDPAARPAVERLAAQLLVSPDDVVVVSVTPAEWPDACLGIPAEGEICASVVTPGYAIVLQVGADSYHFRSDLNGEKLRLAGAPRAETGDPLVTWRDVQSFTMMIIGTERVATGRRGCPLIAAPLAVPERASELQSFLAHYGPFEAKTPAGDIALRGVGSARPTDLEQRLVAEWARLVSIEARAGGERPEAALALTWERTVAASGACDRVDVFRTGSAVATSCRGGVVLPVATVALTSAELAELYGWVDRLEAFTAEPETGPQGSTLLDFRGFGVDEITPTDRAAILAWIDAIALRLRRAAVE